MFNNSNHGRSSSNSLKNSIGDEYLETLAYKAIERFSKGQRYRLMHVFGHLACLGSDWFVMADKALMA